VLDRDLAPRRFDDASSPWLRSFSLAQLKVLVVCRGPVRLEAFQVFDEIGVREYGMLLSEKDSVVYPRCLAPELRSFRFPQNVHRVPDYTGAGQEQKQKRIAEKVGPVEFVGYDQYFDVPSVVKAIVVDGKERETLAGHADLMSFYQTAAVHELAKEFE